MCLLFSLELKTVKGWLSISNGPVSGGMGDGCSLSEASEDLLVEGRSGELELPKILSKLFLIFTKVFSFFA